MWLETILCKFRQITVTENALMLLETVLCEFGQICATGNVPLQLETTLCEFGQIYATGNPSVTNCWQQLHFEFSRQNLSRNVQTPSMW